MGVYVKHYNKWLLVNEKQPWARHLEEAKKKKYRFVARMINKDSTGLGDCDDVDLDGVAPPTTQPTFFALKTAPRFWTSLESFNFSR